MPFNFSLKVAGNPVFGSLSTTMSRGFNYVSYFDHPVLLRKILVFLCELLAEKLPGRASRFIVSTCSFLIS
jgi:hypothetical protein